MNDTHAFPMVEDIWSGHRRHFRGATHQVMARGRLSESRVMIAVVGIHRRRGGGSDERRTWDALAEWSRGQGKGAATARIAPAKFAVAGPPVRTLDDVCALAEEVLRVVARADRAVHGPAFPRAWIGISVFPDGGDDAGVLLGRAELALDAVHGTPSCGIGEWKRMAMFRAAGVVGSGDSPSPVPHRSGHSGK